ncbi:type I-E CRISPR-associated protein Cse1/CasA [Nocardiopsis sp. NPDC049922]|uniref:type I-E CRISPR-associated protein Cse1/CasA n=1 Tax=Nocardiopsis sp. NPDC049922 TaxID=3155157 RepID=UPI0033EB55F1
MNHTTGLNLMDDPWLPYVDLDGRPGVGSVRHVLTHAHEIRDLTVDVPTQYPPILRMLLAVLHRALAGKDARGRSRPRNATQWRTLHRADRLPRDLIDTYAVTWREAFALFHPERPFMQVGPEGLTAKETRPASLLVSYASAGNNAPIFSAQRDDAPDPLTLEQAARWLLHTHAWDTAGIKTGASQDPAAKNGKTTGNRTGPLGDLGVLVPTGANLRETLLFNLLDLGEDLSSPDDLPVWERGPLTAKWTTRAPRGLLDLYTWTARRIRLVPENLDGATVVRRVLVCAGDRLDGAAHVLHGREPHTAWYKPRAKGRDRPADESAPAYRPIRHDPGQELWRGLGGILGWDRGLRLDDGIKPQALRQLTARFTDGPGLPVLRLRASGVSYGLQNAVVADTFADTLPLPVALLMEGGDHSLGEMAVACVSDTESAAWALGELAADLVFAEGGDADAEKSRRHQARRRFYADLDHRFRAWIATVTDPDLEEEYRARWHAIARKAAERVETALLAQVGPGGLRSRARPGKDKNGDSVKVNSATARRTFRARLRRYLGSGTEEA